MKPVGKRKPLGQRLIASLEQGLEAVRTGKELPTTFVPIPPDPPPFEKKRLVALRKQYEMSQAGFAAFLNVSDKAVESWEQGVRTPNGAALRLLQFLERPSLFLKSVGPVRAAGITLRRGGKSSVRKTTAKKSLKTSRK